MKHLVRSILLLSLLTAVQVQLNAQTGIGDSIYFEENFETGSKPSGWTEEYVTGTEPWRYRNGGHSPDDNNWEVPANEVDVTRNPPGAHGGTYNAIFFKQSTNHEATRLVTKAIDLEYAIKPELNFWLCQVPWPFSGNTSWDSLKVYYKSNYADDWVLLQKYLDPISEWTEYKINLPNPSATYYIAFEGITGWGFGTCIDDISIVEKGTQQRYVSELNVVHPDYTFIPSGSRNEPILRIGVRIFGNAGSATLGTVVAKSLNTDDADISDNGVKLYYTKTTVFDTLTPLGSGKSFVSGTITFDNLNYDLDDGQSYVWLTYNIKKSATHGDIADAMFQANSILVGDSLYPNVDESPVGNRVIYETIYRQNFDGTSNWTLNGEFEIDTPQGKGGATAGFPDPTAAYSGTKVLGTDLTGLGNVPGDYENNVTEAVRYKATSPAINALFYKNLKISYRRYLNIELWDNAAINASKDNGITWNNIWYNNTYLGDNLWQKTSHDVLSSISRSNQLKFMFTLGPTNSNTTYSGWNVDDFIVTGDYITKDVGVVEWVYPLSGCGHSATDSVVVKVANLGAEASPASIPVQYSFNNGSTWVTNYLNQSIPAGDTVEFTFSTKVNLSTPGIKSVKARTKLTGDEDASNDVFSSQVYIVPTYTLPFVEDFESSNGYWRTLGVNLWEWGMPNKSSITGSSKAWVTSLTKTYGEVLNSNEKDTLFYDDFENSTGWTLTGEFEIDTPVFVWDTIPLYSYDGYACLGTDLTRLGANKGMYEPDADWEAKTPAINISDYNNLTLYYYSFNKLMSGDTAIIQASSNGISWQNIYSSNGEAIEQFDWKRDSIHITDSLTNTGTIYFRFLLKANGDANVAEGINIDDVWLTGKKIENGAAYLQSPCFDFTGVDMPIMDLSIFNNTEPEVDGTTLFYSLDDGETWQHVENAELNDKYFNWYTDSTVSSLGLDGWNGIGTEWERTRHQLPSAIANASNVIFRLEFKADKANNNYGGTAIDNFKLYEAPFDVGVSAINSPATTCDLSEVQPVQVRINNYGIRNMEAGDTIVLGLNIDHAMVPDNYTDTVVLSSTFNAGAFMDYTIGKNFNMSVSGDYTLTAFTKIEDDPLFYFSPANDTATALVTVQKPYVELGADIWTLQPDTVVLDATNTDPLVTYKWYKDPDYGTVIGTGATYAVPDHDGGKYVVQLDNAIPCSATDTIIVHRLVRDVGVPEFDSPVSSCELSEKTPLQVYVKNFGTDTLMVGDTIRLHYIFNGAPQVDSTWVMDKELLPNDSLLFSFSDSLDMQVIAAYTLRVWANVWLDETSGNDETSEIVNVWGYPSFSLQDTMGLPKDSVQVFNTYYTLDAGSWDAYLWLRDSSTSQTYDQYETGWGVVTVYDTHHCDATDSVYVDLRFSDVALDSVISPVTACESSGMVCPRILIKNAGTDTLVSGTVVYLKYWLNDVLKDEPTLTLDSKWNPGELKDISFGIPVDISAIGTYNFDFKVTADTDTKHENDSVRHVVNIYGYPLVELGDPVFTRSENYVLDAGAGYDNYSWSTGEISQQITVNTTDEYKVTVTNNGMCSTKDSVVVTFLKHDYAVNEIISPVTSCSTVSKTPVSLKFSNVGNDTLKTGQQVTFGYQIDDELFAQETYSLVANLYPGQFIVHTFAEKVDLSAANHHITAYGVFEDDVNTSNDTIDLDFEIKESPVVNLGSDRVDRTGNVTLDGSEGTSYTYLWQDNSTDRFFIVENSGTYWVTTTASNGCFDQDTVSLTMLKPDYRVSAINTPSSSCELTAAEQVQVEVENLGTDTLQVGENLYVSYEVNGAIQQTSPIVMTSKFKPGDKLNFSFSKTYNMSSVGTYTIKAYTVYSDDLNPYNDAITVNVIVWGYPTVSLGNDTAFCQGASVTLDAGSGASSYLWSTGASTQTISVNSVGEYWVEYTDMNGCSNRDTVQIAQNSLPTVTHSSLDPVCLDQPAFTLTGGSPAGGVYSGAGVSGSSFNASSAGEGSHTLTYFYTDGNGCSNSTNVDITVNPLPVVDLGSDTSAYEPFDLDAGAGFSAYLWQDGSTHQTYTVETSGLYSVTVTDGNGCKGSDEINVTFLETLDVIVSSLIAPESKCYDGEEQPVTVELTNRGTKTFTSGESLTVGYKLGSASAVTENHTFTSSLAPNATTQHNFSNGVTLSTGDFTFKGFTTIEGKTGDTTSFAVSIYEHPNLNLGPDTIKKSLPYVLQSGIGNVTYSWNTGATGASITVNEHGKYWLTVTDANGCVASDTIVVYWPDNVGIIPGTNTTITLFPNPARTEVYVKIEGEVAQKYVLELLSTQGLILSRVETETAMQLTHKVPVNDLSAGVYFLRVRAGNAAAVLKLIVNK